MISCEHSRHDFGPRRDPVTAEEIAPATTTSKPAYLGIEVTNTCNRCGTTKVKIIAHSGAVLSVKWVYPLPEMGG